MKTARYVGYANLDRPAETPDRNPMQTNELQNLIEMAAERGYTLETANKMNSHHGSEMVILSELYAAWYAMENNLTVFDDNFGTLIEFTGWQRAMLRAA